MSDTDTTQAEAPAAPADAWAAIEASMGEVYDKSSGEEDKPADDTAPAAPEDGDGGETKSAEPQGNEDPDGEAEEEADKGSDKGEGADEPSLSPPERWSAADKEAFTALPREAQDLVLKRERDVQKHLSQQSQTLKQERDQLGAVARELEQRKQAFATQGMTPDQAVTQLFALSDYAAQKPEEFIQWFAKQRGIELGKQTAATDDGYGDPQIKALQDKIDRLEQGISQTEQQRRQEAERQQQMTAQQRRQSTQQALEEFASDTKAAPYFHEIQSDIATILPGIRQQNPDAGPKEWLKMAYEKAVWANPNTRAKEMKRAQEADRRASQKTAQKAKGQAGTNIRSGGTVKGGDSTPGSIDETLEATYDRLKAG